MTEEMKTEAINAVTELKDDWLLDLFKSYCMGFNDMKYALDREYNERYGIIKDEILKRMSKK